MRIEWTERAERGYASTIEDRPELRRGPITRRTILTYRVRYEEEVIELINIHSTYQDPPDPEDH